MKNKNVNKLLKILSKKESIALDCILQYSIWPEGNGFSDTDPHVVVGAYARRLIRDEAVSDIEKELVAQALPELPNLGEEPFDYILNPLEELGLVQKVD